MTEIAIVDYGAGNLQSVRNALEMAGEDPEIAATPEEILAANRLVIPGVGAAGHAIGRMREAGIDQALNEAIREKARPALGICLGMQLAAAALYEHGENDGLGWIAGDVKHLREVKGVPARVPHMGWNEIEPADGTEELFDAVRGKRSFYFCHSYTLRDAPEDTIAATVAYGVPLVAAIRTGTFFATQFHPEKSQIKGQQLIEAFLEWKP